MNNETLYDDSAQGGYSLEEKKAMVERGEMDPAEIGMPSPNDPKLIGEITPEEKLKQAKLGTDLIMEIGEAPLALRAHWAMQDLKIPVAKEDQASWIESWVAEHKDEHLLQARIRCGYVSAVMEFLSTDAVLGIIHLMEKGALAVKQKYEQQLQYEKETAKTTDSTEQPDSRTTEGTDAISPK